MFLSCCENAAKPFIIASMLLKLAVGSCNAGLQGVLVIFKNGGGLLVRLILQYVFIIFEDVGIHLIPERNFHKIVEKFLLGEL